MLKYSHTFFYFNPSHCIFFYAFEEFQVSVTLQPDLRKFTVHESVTDGMCFG